MIVSFADGHQAPRPPRARAPPRIQNANPTTLCTGPRSGILVRSLEPVPDPGLVSAIVAADHELAAIAAEMITWKREHPADDLLTALVHAEEELLRYDSPVQASRRITVAPVTVGGTEIPAGELVMASLGSANRDEHFWGPDAGQLRVRRENARQHVSFGAGPHHCLRGPAHLPVLTPRSAAALSSLNLLFVYLHLPTGVSDVCSGATPG